MTEKRFTVEPTIVDNTTGEQLGTFDYTERLCEVLNVLYDENNQLKNDLKIIQDSLWTTEYIRKLEKENQRLIKMLDNVANFMQRQNRNTPLDVFVERWNKIATEGLDD